MSTQSQSEDFEAERSFSWQEPPLTIWFVLINSSNEWDLPCSASLQQSRVESLLLPRTIESTLFSRYKIKISSLFIKCTFNNFRENIERLNRSKMSVTEYINNLEYLKINRRYLLDCFVTKSNVNFLEWTVWCTTYYYLYMFLSSLLGLFKTSPSSSPPSGELSLQSNRISFYFI